MTEQQMTQKLMDIHEIKQLMARYEYYHSGGLHRECVALFSQRDDVKVEIANLGIFDGQDGLRRFFIGANSFAEESSANLRKGHMHLHMITTPIIEIAGDSQTAQAIWLSPGAESAPGMMPDSWCWVKYGIDFILEDGIWKFWHFHMYRIFTTAFDKSWADAEYEESRYLPPEMAPDRPNSYRWEYSRESCFEIVPHIPEPYETWDDAQSYVP